MFHSLGRSLALVYILFLSTTVLQGQAFRPEPYARNITSKELTYHIEYLTDSLLQGRETGTPGAVAACAYVMEKFKQYGLLPVGHGVSTTAHPSYIQGFMCNQTKRGRNVVGCFPADVPGHDEYIIVSAHYDHLGIINGIRYPGADSNASGLSVLLTLARTLGQMKKDGVLFTHNILFVAYDAKEYSMAGARAFAHSLPILPEHISANINIDQMGTILAPPSRSTDYVLVLGASTLPPHLLRSLNNSNFYYNVGLEIDYSFYNSPAFADIYFSITEQFWLSQKNVPSLLITSGVHDHTYKPTDSPDIIETQVLKKRTQWLFFFIWDLVQRL
ncbi:MAG TPA: M28 family peptidase [Bacteroidales bacterium]|nr:M28 family peptidase [Bacteroidales bacterium]